MSYFISHLASLIYFKKRIAGDFNEILSPFPYSVYESWEGNSSASVINAITETHDVSDLIECMKLWDKKGWVRNPFSIECFARSLKKRLKSTRLTLSVGYLISKYVFSPNSCVFS